jgi:hypothetical protein
MAKTCPRSYREFTCLNCGSVSRGSGGGTKKYCPRCIHKYIEQLQDEKEKLKKVIDEAYQEDCDGCKRIIEEHVEALKGE